MTSDAVPAWREFVIEPYGAATATCDCCGGTTSRVWGFVSHNSLAVGAYFVTWTQRSPDHGAIFELVLGEWTDSSSKKDRYLIALEFRIVGQTPQFMVVDADSRSPASQSLAENALRRVDVIGTPLAAHVFAVIDALYLTEDRIKEIREWSAVDSANAGAGADQPNQRH